MNIAIIIFIALTAIMGYFAYTNNGVEKYDSLMYLFVAGVFGVISVLLVVIKLVIA